MHTCQSAAIWWHKYMNMMCLFLGILLSQLMWKKLSWRWLLHCGNQRGHIGYTSFTLTRKDKKNNRQPIYCCCIWGIWCDVRQELSFLFTCLQLCIYFNPTASPQLMEFSFIGPASVTSQTAATWTDDTLMLPCCTPATLGIYRTLNYVYNIKKRQIKTRF